MSKPVPSLSSSGWVNEISEKASRLMAYFFASDQSQTQLYGDNIASLPYIVRQFSGDNLDLKNRLEETLSRYLGRYFDVVSVEVTVTVNDDTVEAPGLDLKMDITVVENGVRYSMGRLINTVNSSIMKIIELNNG